MIKSRFLWLIGSLCLIALAFFIISVGGTAVASDQSAQSSSSPRFLTGPNRGAPLDIALDYISRNRESLGLTQADVSDFIVTDQYTSRHNGITHIYLRQVYRDIEVFGANININIARDGSVINMGNQFISDLASGINAAEPRLTAVDAVHAAAQSLNLTISEVVVEQEKFNDDARTTLLSDGGISLEAIPARLVYQPVERQGVRLAWEVEIYELDAQNWWNIRIDAQTGAELGRFNYVIHDNFGEPGGTAHSAPAGAAAAPPEAPQNSMLPDQYNVYAMPLESPSHGGRTLEVDPADTTASPFGWHDTNGSSGAESTFTVGNNVDAYEDTNNSNSPTGGNSARADGGVSLNFDFPINLSQQPSSYQDAAITNLFYWNNIIHDVMYQYGFDEAGGNFQENNYGNGGAGSDSVNAEAQDGGGTNNANFATPSDGSNPRMQMYLWNLTSPMRDGDLDNGIIIHEYGHGISNRLTGGPGNVFCLNNTEQAGEGWSDWYALMLTIEAGDAGTDRRGIGTYALGQPTTGDGIRTYPYSTDMGIDPRTYDTIKTAAVPHGVGSTWAAIAWEVTWALIDQYGFDPDIYNGSGGNNMALQLITDGLKLQPCSPGFVDARDAILLADQNNNGGANQCLLWEAFAKRGLGVSADQGSSGNRSDGTEAFDLPVECQGPPPTNTPGPSPTPTNTPLPTTCTTYNSSDVPIALPNGVTSISSDLSVPTGGNIADVNFSVDMAHVWVGDLSMALSHSAANVTVFDRPGVPASTFGCSGDDIFATLDDSAALPVENQCGAGVPTINGTFSPNNPLSGFNGQDSSGTWTLTVTDHYPSADAGTLNGWSVEICVEDGSPPPTDTPPPPPTDTPPPPPTNTPVPPTPTNTPVPPTPTATPGATSLHVADLDGTSINNGGTWTAVVTILVVDNNGAPVQGATVSGNWSNGATGSAVCVTDSSGTCDVAASDIPKKIKEVAFTVSDVDHATLTYNPAANTDPDGDSNGTTIVVIR
jgi:subtilisin-like proprotein convertase family protein